MDGFGAWFSGALGELRGLLAFAGVQAAGPPGGMFARELFTDAFGQATLYIPAAAEPPDAGRIRGLVIPAADVAVVTHHGTHDGIDRSYGALGTYVAERLTGAGGPIRERYLDMTPDGAFARTEIAWPVLSAGGQARQDSN
jgi:effector-binding domain-containing protein